MEDAPAGFQQCLRLAVVGIVGRGKRDVLAFHISDRENQLAWEDLLDDLTQRSVKEIGLWISDGNQTMLSTLTTKFPTSARQRCVVHKMGNVLSYIPTKQHEQVEPELKALFSQKASGRSGDDRLYREVSEHLPNCH